MRFLIALAAIMAMLVGPLAANAAARGPMGKPCGTADPASAASHDHCTLCCQLPVLPGTGGLAVLARTDWADAVPITAPPRHAARTAPAAAYAARAPPSMA